MIDEAHVQQLAAQHLELLEAARKAAATRVGPRPAEVWDRDIGPLMRDLDHESRAYTAAYNALIGSEKLLCENHEAGINVEWSGRERDGARLHVDRYLKRVECFVSVGGHHERIPIEIRHADHRLSVLLDGVPTSAGDAIIFLLDGFTTLSTKAECEEM